MPTINNPISLHCIWKLLDIPIAALDTMPPLVSLATTRQSTFDGYFQQSMVTTVFQTKSLEIYVDQLKDFLGQEVIHEVVQRVGLKGFAILNCI